MCLMHRESISASTFVKRNTLLMFLLWRTRIACRSGKPYRWNVEFKLNLSSKVSGTELTSHRQSASFASSAVTLSTTSVHKYRVACSKFFLWTGFCILSHVVKVSELRGGIFRKVGDESYRRKVWRNSGRSTRKKILERFAGKCSVSLGDSGGAQRARSRRSKEWHVQSAASWIKYYVCTGETYRISVLPQSQVDTLWHLQLLPLEFPDSCVRLSGCAVPLASSSHKMYDSYCKLSLRSSLSHKLGCHFAKVNKAPPPYLAKYKGIEVRFLHFLLHFDMW